MSRMKSGAIILLLVIPFGLYCAWQVQSVTSTDLSAAEPPSEKGLPGKDQLAAGKAKAEKWAGDVKRALTVALQYGELAKDEPVADAASKALADTAVVRARDLTDLEKFLMGGADPVFTGSRKELFKKWEASKKQLAKTEQTALKWLTDPLPSAVDSAATAATAMRGFEELVTEYRNASEFADLGKAEVWRIEARLKVIQSLDAEVRVPYAEAMKIPLPFPKDDPRVAKAVGAPKAIREQIELLKEDLARAEDAKRAVPPRVAKAAADAVARDTEWVAKAELLGLFADPELFTDPLKAGKWIPKVQTQFNKAQSEREEIKNKVQQFCAAYIPKSVRLDDKVLIFRGETEEKMEARAAITVVYDSDLKDQKLSESLEAGRLNEFNYADASLFKNLDKIRWDGGNRVASRTQVELRPTEKSGVARDFYAARVTVKTWSIDTVKRLKTACEGEVEALQKSRRDHADSLLGGETGGEKKPAPAVWTRLTDLAAVMEKHKGLFEGP